MYIRRRYQSNGAGGDGTICKVVLEEDRPPVA